MKKFFAAAIAVLMTASLAACGSTPSSSAAENAAPASSAASTESAPSDAGSGNTYRIGLAQIMEHTSLNQIRDSFTAEMEALGYGPDKVEIDYQIGRAHV